MKLRSPTTSLLTLLLTFTLISCNKSASNDASATATSRPASSSGGGQPVVHAVNYPLTYFAQRIGGDHVDVQFIAPSDGDPAFWEPTAEDAATLQAADLVLLNGATYAKWRGHISLPRAKTVNTSAAFATSYIKVEEGETHSHGDEEHSHAGTAFTTWIDLSQAAQQAEAVRDALVELAPDAADQMKANAATLVSEINQLDSNIQAIASIIGDRPLVASHPIYQYFARRYNLNIQELAWEPEVVPDDAAMQDLADILQGHAAKWMVWEGDPDPTSVAKLKAVGVESMVFDPCGNRPDEGDWLSTMKDNVERLKVIK